MFIVVLFILFFQFIVKSNIENEILLYWKIFWISLRKIIIYPYLCKYCTLYYIFVSFRKTFLELNEK